MHKKDFMIHKKKLPPHLPQAEVIQAYLLIPIETFLKLVKRTSTMRMIKG